MKSTKFRNIKVHTFKYRQIFFRHPQIYRQFCEKVVQMINGCSISYSRSFFFVCIIAFMSFQPDGLSMASVQRLGFLLTL